MTTRPTTVVLGPLTRAGRSLAERAASRGEDVFLVARDDSDVAALSGGDASVLRIDQDVDLLGHGEGPVRIVVCALGPVHPVAVRTEADAHGVLRDLGAIERLLTATAERPAGVVLVSSIIALAPGEDRRYYGGWKALVEQQLAETVQAAAPGSAFSVVYPGRLVDGPARRAVPGLHTSYARLAATVERLADGPSRARVSGIDARLWLVANALRLLLGTVLPLRPSGSGRALAPPVSANERYSSP